MCVCVCVCVCVATRFHQLRDKCVSASWNPGNVQRSHGKVSGRFRTNPSWRRPLLIADSCFGQLSTTRSWGFPLSTFPEDTTNKLASFVFTQPACCWAESIIVREAVSSLPILWRVMFDPTRESNQRLPLSRQALYTRSIWSVHRIYLQSRSCSRKCCRHNYDQTCEACWGVHEFLLQSLTKILCGKTLKKKKRKENNQEHGCIKNRHQHLQSVYIIFSTQHKPYVIS